MDSIATVSKIKSLMICPKCKSSNLRYSSSKIQCVSCNSTYEYCGNHPVMVDFNKSVLNKKEFFENSGNSFVKRRKVSIPKKIKIFFSSDSYITRKNIKKIINLLSVLYNPRILIIGGGTVGNGIENIYLKYENIISFDIYSTKNITLIADSHSIPFKNSTFDLVIIQAVLEHVLEPNLVVSEIERVMKEDGLIYSETPFMQQVHEGAYDFTRFTESGHRYLFKNFDCINSGFTKGLGTSLVWSLAYFFKGIFRSQIIFQLTKVLFFWLKYFDKLIPNKYNIDGASGCYFLGKKNKKILSNNDIIGFYDR
tara:strand:+ start:267 stop:1196 length:930 start_codon:yes stop_codon:yes gene_type:complete